MATTTNRYLSYPAAAAGISRASSGSTAWSYSAYTEVVPASTSPLICYFDFGSDQISSSGNFTIAWNK